MSACATNAEYEWKVEARCELQALRSAEAMPGEIAWQKAMQKQEGSEPNRANWMYQGNSSDSCMLPFERPLTL